MNTKGCVLCFQLESRKQKQIEQVCRSLGLQVKKIYPAEYQQKLGYLAGVKGFAKEKQKAAGDEFPTEMLLFSGMSSEILDAFLTACKQAFIPPTPLKAVITMHNIYWTPVMLYEELQKEHASMMEKRK